MMPAQWRTLGRELTEGLTKPLTLKPAHEVNGIDDDLTLYSIGSVARMVGYSVSGVAKLERKGVIPAAFRIEGTDRRVYRMSDINRIKSIIEDRRAEREMPA